MTYLPFVRHLVLALVLMGSWGCTAKPQKQLPLETIIDIPLGQATSRYDYASLDAKTGLLFIADLAGSRVLVVDVKANRLVKAITGVNHVHGVLAVPSQGRVYASATGDDVVATIDETTLAVIAHVPSGHYPDGMAWVPALNKLYVSNEHGQTVGVIDALISKKLTEIKLGGDVGNTQFDSADGLIYSNNQSTNELIAIDPASDIIVGRWTIPGCDDNHGLLLDPKRQIAYIACQSNAKLVTFSLIKHNVLDTQPIGNEPDVLAMDEGVKRLYIAGERGIVSVFDTSKSEPVKLGEAKLADNAHIVAIDQATHRIYFPLRNWQGKPVLRVMELVK